MIQTGRSDLIQLFLYAGGAFLLYQLNSIFFLLTVPLYLYGMQKGKDAVTLACVLVMFAILGQSIIRTSGISDPVIRRFIVILELSYPSMLIAAVIGAARFKGRMVIRLLYVGCGSGAITIPMIFYYTGHQQIIAFVREQIMLVAEGFLSSTMMQYALTPESITDMVGKIFIRNYLFGWFLMAAGGWALAYGIYCRKEAKPRFQLMQFKVPEKAIYPFLFFWTGILFDYLVGLGLWAALFWNGGLILIFIYGLHGIGLIRYLFNAYNVQNRVRFFITLLIVFMFFVPGMNIIILVGLPGLGVSELWVRYRQKEDNV